MRRNPQVTRKRSHKRRTGPRDGGWLAAARGLGPVLWALPLAAFTAVWVSGGPNHSRGTTTAKFVETHQFAGLSEADRRKRKWPVSATALDAAQPNLTSHPVGRDARDSHAARFTMCGGGPRINCVVDGDTFWYRGNKIRIADINAPEVGHPQCADEAELGARATNRLLVLMNQGAFSLESIERDRDQYGRYLRTVTRGGNSVGEELVREGLAERWKGYRGNWC